MEPASLRLGRSNLYLLDSGDGLVLIDAGAPHPSATGGWVVFARWLSAQGHQPSHVRALLLTHAHPDHLALAQALQRLGARVFAHRAEADVLVGREGRDAVLSQTRHLFEEHGVPEDLAEDWVRMRFRRWTSPPLEPNGILDDGAALCWGHLRLRAVHCPGHSPGSTAYYHAETRSLFSGDHLLRRTLPHLGLYFDEGGRFKALPAYLRSLDKVAALEIDRVYPGHGPAFGDVPVVIRWLRRQHEVRLAQAMELLKRGPATAFELLPQLFPKLRPYHWRLGLGQVIGWLDELEGRGWVEGKRQKTLRSVHAINPRCEREGAGP